ncbi:hypothetical protein FORC53_1981 [Vibrio vulnificus]|uniref:Uncharacterized protein n=1 Tax=Vibrio vulnificus TaxID=672 RepID=A0AAN1PPI0_VIBVL|nr:hypothetical protein FORC53_1981 [Vibrio vulnificus]
MYCQKIEECEETHRTEIEEGKIVRAFVRSQQTALSQQNNKSDGSNHRFESQI